jgi:hypothetical protein
MHRDPSLTKTQIVEALNVALSEKRANMNVEIRWPLRDDEPRRRDGNYQLLIPADLVGREGAPSNGKVSPTTGSSHAANCAGFPVARSCRGYRW